MLFLPIGFSLEVSVFRSNGLGRSLRSGVLRAYANPLKTVREKHLENVQASLKRAETGNLA
jgi:hypothetical protein